MLEHSSISNVLVIADLPALMHCYYKVVRAL